MAASKVNQGEVLEWMFYSGDYQSFIQAVEEGTVCGKYKTKETIYTHFAKEFNREFVQILYRERAGMDPAVCQSELEGLAEKHEFDKTAPRKGKRGAA